MIGPLPFQAGQADHPSNLTRIHITPDDNAIFAVVELMIRRSGLSQKEIARRMGIVPQSLAQYRRRTRPSLRWITRLSAAVGANVYIEFRPVGGR